MTRRQLDDLLARFAAARPQMAAVTDREFILRPRRLTKIHKAIMVTIWLLLIAMFLGSSYLAFTTSDPVERRQTGTFAAALILLAGCVGIAIDYANSVTVRVDLHTGNVARVWRGRYLFRYNMSSVRSYRRFVKAQAFGVKPILLESQVVVPGQSELVWKPFFDFYSPVDFQTFEPVMSGLIGYFRDRPEGTSTGVSSQSWGNRLNTAATTDDPC